MRHVDCPQCGKIWFEDESYCPSCKMDRREVIGLLSPEEVKREYGDGVAYIETQNLILED